VRVRGVQRDAAELPVLTVAIHDSLSSRRIQVGEDDVLVEVTTGSDRCERRPDAARTNDRDLHM